MASTGDKIVKRALAAREDREPVSWREQAEATYNQRKPEILARTAAALEGQIDQLRAGLEAAETRLSEVRAEIAALATATE